MARMISFTPTLASAYIKKELPPLVAPPLACLQKEELI